MLIETRLKGKFVIQMAVGKTPKGKTAYKSITIYDVGVGLSDAQVEEYIAKYQKELFYPISKFRYIQVDEGIHYENEEYAQKRERKKLRAERKIEREAKKAAKEANAQTTLAFPEENAAPEAAAMIEEETTAEESPAPELPEEAEEKKKNPLFSAWEKVSGVITDLVHPETAGELPADIPPQAGTEEAAGEIKIPDETPAMKEAERPPLEIKVIERTISPAHPQYQNGEIDEFLAVIKKMLDDANVPPGRYHKFTYAQLIDAKLPEDFLLCAGITPQEPLLFGIDPDSGEFIRAYPKHRDAKPENKMSQEAYEKRKKKKKLADKAKRQNHKK